MQMNDIFVSRNEDTEMIKSEAEEILTLLVAENLILNQPRTIKGELGN